MRDKAARFVRFLEPRAISLRIRLIHRTALRRDNAATADSKRDSHEAFAGTREKAFYGVHESSRRARQTARTIGKSFETLFMRSHVLSLDTEARKYGDVTVTE